MSAVHREYKQWSEVEQCPDCGALTLRVWLGQRPGEEPFRTDEFCDNPNCGHGD